MAANQKNSKLYQYTDDNAVNWSVRGPIDTGINAVDGNQPLSTDPVWGKQTLRRHVRMAIFQDPSTFRTVRFPVFTAAAFTALVAGATIARNVEGETATVNYDFVEKIAEKQPVPHPSRNLADHA